MFVDNVIYDSIIYVYSMYQYSENDACGMRHAARRPPARWAPRACRVDRGSTGAGVESYTSYILSIKVYLMEIIKNSTHTSACIRGRVVRSDDDDDDEFDDAFD